MFSLFPKKCCPFDVHAVSITKIFKFVTVALSIVNGLCEEFYLGIRSLRSMLMAEHTIASFTHSKNAIINLSGMLLILWLKFWTAANPLSKILRKVNKLTKK